MRKFLIAIVIGVSGLGIATIRADPPCGTDHTHERAGGSDRIAPWARPGVTCKYAGGYVGGSRPVGGESRDPAVDGTWGVDYVGRGWWPQRIFLGWSHDARRQPKPGPYQTDGRHVPDVLAAPPGADACRMRD